MTSSTYGYVLTVHKSQGSQWNDVVLFDESFAFQESAQGGSTPALRVRQNG